MLNLGLVGCGGMGLRHAYGAIEARRVFGSVRMTAVCDRHETVATHVATELEGATGEKVDIFTDFDQMLTKARYLDAIDIVTDTRMHHVFALRALDAGLHVLTEKPMGLTLALCRKMREMAEIKGLLLSIAEQYRRDPMHRLTRALLDGGAIGKPRFALKAMVAGGSALMHNTGWRALKSRAGSVILEQGVHEADLLLYFLGDVKEIYAQTRLVAKTRHMGSINPTLANFYGHRVEDYAPNQNTVETDQEDTAFGVLTFESGVVAQFTITNASRGLDAFLNSIHGSEGSLVPTPSRSGEPPRILTEERDQPIVGDALLDLALHWRLDDATAQLFGSDRIAAYNMPFAEIDRKLIALEMHELAQAVEKGGSVEVGPEEGMKALAVAYGILESGTSGAPVLLKDVMSGAVSEYQRELDESIS